MSIGGQGPRFKDVRQVVNTRARAAGEFVKRKIQKNVDKKNSNNQ